MVDSVREDLKGLESRLKKELTKLGCKWRAFVWGSERVSPSEAVSLEEFTQGEHRRHDSGSGAKLEKVNQA